MKKNNIKYLLILISVLFLLSGCTTQLRDKKNKVVTYKETGQTITKNILCKPKTDEIKDIYTKYKTNIDNLPECAEFKITSGGYEGLWTSFFVKPLAWLVIKLGAIFKNYGIGIILASLFIRFITFPITKKIAMQSENMKKAQPEINKVEKKYKEKDQNDKDVMMMKTQETMAVYKKYNINPLSGCLFSFLQIPVFFAFLEAINRVPALFEDKFLGFQLGTTPIVGMSNGNYLYLILIVLIIGSTYYSFKLNSTASSPDQRKQMKTMTTFMIIFISIASFSLATGIAFYWIASSLFTIGQNLLAKKKAGNL